MLVSTLLVSVFVDWLSMFSILQANNNTLDFIYATYSHAFNLISSLYYIILYDRIKSTSFTFTLEMLAGPGLS